MTSFNICCTTGIPFKIGKWICKNSKLLWKRFITHFKVNLEFFSIVDDRFGHYLNGPHCEAKVNQLTDSIDPFEYHEGFFVCIMHFFGWNSGFRKCSCQATLRVVIENPLFCFHASTTSMSVVIEGSLPSCMLNVIEPFVNLPKPLEPPLCCANSNRSFHALLMFLSISEAVFPSLYS